MKPLFVFSLPRSGSSLFQKMLTAHSGIESASEPWILLPLVGMVGNRNIVSIANYSTATSQLAMRDLLDCTPNLSDKFLCASRAFADRVYSDYCQRNTVYFLDKTPRYYLIIDEILEIFPDAKFVFLWRNPIAVMASIIMTWQRGRFRLHRHKVDLYEGVRCLHEGFQKHGNNAYSLKYEDLVKNPDKSLKAVCEFLEIEFEESMVRSFGNVKFEGQMGDQSETSELNYLSGASLDSWKTVMNGTARRWYCKRYLEWIGDDILATFGYDKGALVRELREGPTSIGPVLSDLWWMASLGVHGMLTRWLLGRGKPTADRYDYLID